MLLNLPVDNRGLVHQIDAERLVAFGKIVASDLSHDLAKGKPTSATRVRVNITRSRACPTIATFGLFHARSRD